MSKPDNVTLYGGGVRLEFDPDKHVYYVRVQHPDTEKFSPARWVPSVTGITGMLDDGKSNGLIFWATKCMAEEIIERAEKYYETDVALDQVTLPPMVRSCRDAHKREMDKAAQLGTVVHDYIEKHIRYTLGISEAKPPLPKHKKALSGAEAFHAWERANNVSYEFTERRIYSVAHHYAGTLDILATVNGELAIVDIKTSNRIYLVHKLQTAAYAHAIGEEFGETPSKRIILHLAKQGGTFAAHDLEDEARFNKGTQDEDMKAFLGLRAAYYRVKELKSS